MKYRQVDLNQLELEYIEYRRVLVLNELILKTRVFYGHQEFLSRRHAGYHFYIQ